MKRNNNKGFTLAELLIVVAVIAVLVAVAIPTFTDQLEKSRQSVDESNLRGAYAAARLAEIDQAVGDETFKVAAGNPADTAKLIYWYNPDTGALTKAVDGQTATSVDGTVAQLGKATKAKAVADMSQLSFRTIPTDYATSLSTGTAGTRDKAILVQFGKVSGRDAYGIASIKFVQAATGLTGAVAVGSSADDNTKVTLVSGTASVTTLNLTLPIAGVASSNTVDLDDYLTFALDGSTGTASSVTYGTTLACADIASLTTMTNAGVINFGDLSAVRAKTEYTLTGITMSTTVAGVTYSGNVTLNVTAMKKMVESATGTATTTGTASTATLTAIDDLTAALMKVTTPDSGVTYSVKEGSVKVYNDTSPADDKLTNGVTATAAVTNGTKLTITCSPATGVTVDDVKAVKLILVATADDYAPVEKEVTITVTVSG